MGFYYRHSISDKDILGCFGILILIGIGIGSCMNGGPKTQPVESRPAPKVAAAQARQTTPPPRVRTKPLPVVDVRVRVAALAEQRARAKLAPKQYTPLDLARHEIKEGVLWVQRFTADGRTLRTGILESDGELTPLQPDRLRELLPR